MNPFLLPFDLMRITLESQAVIAMRMAGMAGLWRTGPAETARMLREKPEALADAWISAWMAGAGGARPDEVMQAALRPIGRRTRSNAKRLMRAGPGLPAGRK